MSIQGFNEYFVATNSLASRERVEYGAYEWNTETSGNTVGSRAIQDASITNAKIGTAAIGTANIGTLTFNQISGGTAHLGGSSNGDGVLSVSNAAGTEVVRADSNGLTVNYGSLTLKDASGTAFVDSRGLISTANFSAGQGSTTSTIEVTSLSYVDVSGGSVGLTLSNQSRVMINYFISGRHVDSPDGEMFAQLLDNGSKIGPSLGVIGTNFGMTDFASVSFIQTLGTGAHTLKIQVKQNNNPGTAYLENALGDATALVNYLVLGK